MTALSWALSTPPSTNQYPEMQCQNSDTNKTLKEASIIINNLIHEEIKKSSQSQSYTLLNISDELNNINPLLLEFLNSITNSIRERDITNATEHI